MTASPPDLPSKPVRRSILERVSVVWLIPITALLIALGVAWTSYADRGPLLVIAFESASGVKANETDLRYRDISVGLVEKIAFSDTLEKVEVTVRVEKDIAEFVDADASFWVVRPEVTTQGVTGLDTVLSGVFIEGLWDTVPAGFVAFHEGLEDAPLLGVGESGLEIELRATSETILAENSPILYKGIKVGRTGKPRLVGDGTEAIADAIIFSPHDKLISSATRFWDVSGFSFNFGAGGADIDFASLASLISGGVTFDTIVSGGQPVGTKTTFEVYGDEATARASVFSDSSGPPLELAVVFAENVSGLVADAPVELSGVRVGSVTALQGIVDEDRFGDSRVRLLTTLEIRPERLGLGDAATPDEALEYLSDQVDKGLRARLSTASILTGGLKIELLRLGDPSTAVIARTAEGLPILPSGPSNIKDVAATAEGILQRVNELPIEEMIANVNAFLDSAATFMGNEDLQRAPEEIVGLVEEARGIIGSEEIQAVPENLNKLIASLQDATEDLSSMLAELQEAEAVERLLTAVDAAGAAAGEVAPVLEGVPDLIAKIDALADKANALPIEDLVAQANELAASAQSLLSSETTQALPESISGLLDTLNTATADLDTVLKQITEADTVTRLTEAIEAASKAAGDVGGAVEGVPALVEKIDALAAKIGDLPVEDLVSETTEVMASAQDLLAAESTKALPDNLNAALADLQKIVAEITENDGVGRLLASIDAAGEAAAKAGASFEGVPGLVDQISAVAKKADELPLDELVDELTAVLDSADAILSTDGAKELPESLSGALEQLDQVLTELREGGTVQNVNSTLASAANAADRVAAASDDLPALVDRLNRLINQASGTLASYDGKSEINRDVRAAMRQVQRAAEAVAGLARALERRPNAIILGR